MQIIQSHPSNWFACSHTEDPQVTVWLAKNCHWIWADYAPRHFVWFLCPQYCSCAIVFLNTPDVFSWKDCLPDWNFKPGVCCKALAWCQISQSDGKHAACCICSVLVWNGMLQTFFTLLYSDCLSGRDLISTRWAIISQIDSQVFNLELLPIFSHFPDL